MMVNAMLIIPPPMTNAERQRLFQLSHPGYDRRRKARQRARVNHAVAQLRAAAQAQAAAKANPPVLMLPAPVEDLAMAELNALAASLASTPVRQPVPSRAA
jgi:hypothetical protein